MLDLNISTILLQMANFFILVFILYRFLFKPLQNVLKKREEQTIKMMDEAKAAREQAEKSRRTFEEKSKNIKVEIAAQKNEARIVIERTRQQMLHEVKSEIEHLKSQAEETLSQLRVEAVQRHQQEIGHLAADFVRRMLTDLMTPELQRFFLEDFLEKIKREDLAQYMETGRREDASLIKVVFANLPEKAFQEDLTKVLKDKIPQAFDLSFEVDPGLIAGALLRFENELVDGSLSGQIDGLQKKYQEAES